jgi:hypothetical protein
MGATTVRERLTLQDTALSLRYRINSGQSPYKVKNSRVLRSGLYSGFQMSDIESVPPAVASGACQI